MIYYGNDLIDVEPNDDNVVTAVGDLKEDCLIKGLGNNQVTVESTPNCLVCVNTYRVLMLPLAPDKYLGVDSSGNLAFLEY